MQKTATRHGKSEFANTFSLQEAFELWCRNNATPRFWFLDSYLESWLSTGFESTASLIWRLMRFVACSKSKEIENRSSREQFRDDQPLSFGYAVLMAEDNARRKKTEKCAFSRNYINNLSRYNK